MITDDTIQAARLAMSGLAINISIKDSFGVIFQAPTENEARRMAVAFQTLLYVLDEYLPLLPPPPLKDPYGWSEYCSRA